MSVVVAWTGRDANALRVALRLTNEAFAEHLGTALRTVTLWNKFPERVPVPDIQRALDTALARADAEATARFDSIRQTAAPTSAAQSVLSSSRAEENPGVRDALDWIDAATGEGSGWSRSRVDDALSGVRESEVEMTAARRGLVTRERVAVALDAYYRPSLESPFGFYRANTEEGGLPTSILTRPDWLDLQVRLDAGPHELRLDVTDEARSGKYLAGPAAEAAVRRLAETIVAGTRVVNAPLYSLRDLEVSSTGFTGAFAIRPFVEYALTLDLVEAELIDAVSAGGAPLRLRDLYLPTAADITKVGHRLCAGGPLALLAIARPENRRTGRPADYVLLVQERGGKVLNSARRLAVIPKAFHGPLADATEDVAPGATLEREMEEELFGRLDIDSTVNAQRWADPMHPERLSNPMRWLVEHPDAWRTECTGVGFNTMTGNYEFASLIVIDDETWWTRHAGAIEANWESSTLRRYSTRDTPALAALAHDPAWSNEGLFAFLQGLRRLRSIGGDRVRLPRIDVEC